MKKTVELLAPAGDIDSFKAAINAGADAIYMGTGKHNARVMAKNFGIKSFIECIEYAHIRGVKVYLTLNTLVFDDEIDEVLDMLLKLYEAGLDAVILQDIGLASIIHTVMPDVAMHASTQMSAYSIEQVNFLESIGFSRVVLARELTCDEIKKIAKNTNVEIEAFVHGALCVSVSGQCALSYAIGTRSANRGACAQPCRRRYTLYNGLEKLSPKTYLLSKKDIYSLDIIDKVIDSGVYSLKIEGRNKTPEYVGIVTSKYRKYIDEYLNTKKVDVNFSDEKDVMQAFNRGSKCHGYLDGVKYKESITQLSPKNNGLYLGEIIDKKGKYIEIKLNEDIDLHDGIEIYTKKGVISTIVTCILDEKMNILNKSCKSGDIVYIGDIKDDFVVDKNKVYKTSRYTLNQETRKKYVDTNLKQREINIDVIIKKDESVKVIANIENENYIYDTKIVPENAISRQINVDDIKKAFSKTQDKGIKFVGINTQIDEGLYLKVSDLNEIRRLFVDELETKYIKDNRRDINKVQKKIEQLKPAIKTEIKNQSYTKNILSVYSYDKDKKYDEIYFNKYNEKIERIDFNASDYLKYGLDILHKYSKYNLGISIPSFTLDSLDKYITKNIELLLKRGVKTVILGSFRYLKLLMELKKKYEFLLIADYSLNATNSYSAIFLKNLGFDRVTLGLDTPKEDIIKIKKYVDIELIDGYITTMTSRYCILGAFVSNRTQNKICTCPCTKSGYYIEDVYGEKYDIICDSTDCTMRVLKEYKQDAENEKLAGVNIRRNLL